MKKTVIAIAAMFIAFAGAYAQDDVQKAAAQAAAAISETPEQKAAEEKPVYWTKSAQFDLGFNQTSLWSWAAGGYNTLMLNAGIDMHADYAKDLMKWTNRLQMQYGFLWSADKENLLQKSNDLLYLESRWSYKTAPNSKWDYTASFDFRSQFTDSYDQYVQNTDGKWEGTLKSSFASPAYTNIALGMAWVPNDWFNLNIAPLTGGFTICTTEALRKGYGMKLRDDSADPLVGSNYYSSRFQFGAQVKMNLKATINNNFNYETQLVLFTDYLNDPFTHNRVNWDNKFAWQMAKYFKIGFNTWLIYDPIVLINDHHRTQFKEFFSINFTYTISSKK